jgi:hypothetical protein
MQYTKETRRMNGHTRHMRAQTSRKTHPRLHMSD